MPQMTDRAATLPEAFQRTVATHPDVVALRRPGGEWSLTYREYAHEVHRIAGGLAALGVKRGDTVAAMLTNRPEFNLQETAAVHLGATTFSIYNTSSTDQITYLLEHSDCRVVVTERQYADKLRAAGGRVEHILVVEDGDLDALEPAPGFDFEAAWQSVVTNDVLCLIYTSGTTGPPKGVEHTHRSALSLCDSVVEVFPMEMGDSAISYLPSAHAADRFALHYFAIIRGMTITSLDDATKLPEVLGDVRPTVFVAVPRVWGKIKNALDLAFEEAHGPKAALLGRALKLGDKHARAKALGPVERLQFRLLDRVVLGKIRAKLGFERLKWALSGAAPIPPDVYDFLKQIGIPVSEVWGMSECGLGTGTVPAEARQATVGKGLPNAQLRVADDGELLFRAPWVMRGYRDDPEKTAEALDVDGWLHTGDIVTIDAEGYVRIVDRKKELLINAGGKNMSPANIETAIVGRSPLIGSVVAIGDGRPYNVALVTLDEEAVPVFADRLGLEPDPSLMAEDPRVVAIVQQAIDEGNATLARVEQVKQFVILPTFWGPGGDELTPTSKLKRRVITDKYDAEIAALYA